MIQKINRLSALLLIVVIMAACSDDDKMPDQKFSFEGKKISLANAKVYLASEATLGDHLTRSYYITDGTYIGGNGLDLANYTSETYALVIRIGVPQGEDITPGDFPQYAATLDAPDNVNFSHITFVSSNYRFQTTNNVTNGPALMIAGGVDPDETIIFRFDGSLTRYFVVTEEPEGQFPGTFHVKGVVIDKRPT